MSNPRLTTAVTALLKELKAEYRKDLYGTGTQGNLINKLKIKLESRDLSTPPILTTPEAKLYTDAVSEMAFGDHALTRGKEHANNLKSTWWI